MRAFLVLAVALTSTACASPSAISPSAATATTAPLSINSPTYALLARVASDASGISNVINSVTLPYECAGGPSSQCQTTLPDTMTQEFSQLQADVTTLDGGVLDAYSSESLVASDLGNLHTDMNQLPAALGQEIDGHETDNPNEMRMGAQAQNQLAGIDNAALAIRNALSTS